jgi:SAM-dependent methyltransferase
MTNDPFAQFKAVQREGWALFAPFETFTTMTAARLVAHARVRAGQAVLDVGCGTGVVAITAARAGAHVRGLDLSPALLEHARGNAALAGVEIEFREGDAEALPYEDASFDVVLSQFGHIFAPRPEVATAELLRVLKPGGTIAFSTWPPEHFVGRMFALIASKMPPPPGAAPAPPPLWGDPNVVRQRLGDAVTDLRFDRDVMTFPVLSPQHFRRDLEATLAPVAKLVATLEPAKLAAFRAELEAFGADALEGNSIRQIYLLTRATKR